MSDLTGKRIRLVQMGDDPDPMEPGSTGTVESVVEMGAGRTHLNMNWDPEVGRSLNLSLPEDVIEVLKEP